MRDGLLVTGSRTLRSERPGHQMEPIGSSHCGQVSHSQMYWVGTVLYNVFGVLIAGSFKEEEIVMKPRSIKT